jgi:hypothetical protein
MLWGLQNFVLLSYIKKVTNSGALHLHKTFKSGELYTTIYNKMWMYLNYMWSTERAAILSACCSYTSFLQFFLLCMQLQNVYV